MPQPTLDSTTLNTTRTLRCGYVECHNPEGGIPSITYHLSEVVDLGGGRKASAPFGRLTAEMTDPTAEFALLDPATGQPTGQNASTGALFALLFSHAFHLHANSEMLPA